MKETKDSNEYKFISKNETVEIILCYNCNGVGNVPERISAYDNEMVTCPTCKGLGRLRLIKTTTIERL